MPVQLNTIQIDELKGTDETWYIDTDKVKYSINVLIFFSYNYNAIYNFGQEMLDIQHILNPSLKVTVSGTVIKNTGFIPKDLPYYNIDYRVNLFETPDQICESFLARITPYVTEDFLYYITQSTDYTRRFVLQFQNDFDKETVTQQISNIQAMLLSNHML